MVEQEQDEELARLQPEQVEEEVVSGEEHLEQVAAEEDLLGLH